MKKLLLLTLFCFPLLTFAQSVPGCMDSTACNFDALADTSDGSCTYPGCTDVFACNYDSTAGCDDGSCAGNQGCTDPTACNYDATAGCDDGSCTGLLGCTDPFACNYDSLATCDDGSCAGNQGCTDPTACNYDATATCDDGSCILADGCTDPLATNYDANAVCDDGSCQYPQINSISPNSGDQGQTLSVTISGSSMNYGNQWSGTLSDFRFKKQTGGGSGSGSGSGNGSGGQSGGYYTLYGNPTYTSANNLYGNVSIPSTQPPGYYFVEVFNQNTGQWVQKDNAFYVNYYAPLAQINSISPSSGDQGQTLSVSISGTNMNYGNQWSGTLSSFRFSQWSGSNMFYGNPTSESGNYLYGDVSVPSGQNTGYYDLEVWDNSVGNWIILNNAFEVNQTPVITPDSAKQGQTLQVFISGNHQGEFEEWSCMGGPAQLRLSNNGYDIAIPNNVSSWQYNNNTGTDGFYTNINIPYSAPLGDYNFEVQYSNCGGSQYGWSTYAYNAFEVYYSPYGCTDPNAYNYDSTSIYDDSTCMVCDNGSYTGPVVVNFTKQNYADWHNPSNRDIITPTCELTRRDDQGLFNYATQSDMYDNYNNSNIEYALGSYDNYSSPWVNIFTGIKNYLPCNNMNCLPGNIVTIHILDDDLYFELSFNSWSCCGQGGGFSYTRTSVCDEVPLVYGCTYLYSTNYDPAATFDDGSCIYSTTIEPDSAPRGQVLPVFISGNSPSDFEVWSYIADLSLYHTNSGIKIPIQNNKDNWVLDSVTNTSGFYTNLDLSSSNILSNYTGPVVVNFTKQDGADWHQVSNRDIITPTCELTRENNHGLFNYATQSSMYDQNGNENIEYAMGTYENYSSPWFSLFRDLRDYTNCWGLQCLAGHTITIHILDDDLYFELDFTSWSSGQQGGFSYTRTLVNMGSDPLFITEGLYSLNKIGVGTGSLCDIVDEGNTLTLTAPPGAIISSIDFASYGTPTGSCGNFSNGYCHSPNSQNEVENACLNQNSCSVTALSSTFGDPCTGINKQLAVQATFSYGNNPPLTVLNPAAFTVTQGLPELLSITPDNESEGNQLSVTISGLSMDFGSFSSTLSNFRITNGSTTINGSSDSTQGIYLYGDITIPLFTQVGMYDLEVYDNLSGTWIQKIDAFEVLPLYINPDRITPNHAMAGDSLGVFISGVQSEFENWSWGGGAPIRLRHLNGSTIPIVNYAYSNWTYDSIVQSDGFFTSIQVPNTATLGAYDLEVDVYASGNNWQLLESSAFGVGVWGCTDSTSWNYDSNANFDDGSCHCENVTVSINTRDNYSEELSWEIVDDFGNTLAAGGYNVGEIYQNNYTYTTNACLPASCSYSIILYDNYGWGWSAWGTASLSINDTNGLTLFSMSGNCCWSQESFPFSSSFQGCTDSTATNYDANAVCDDGSCCYSGVQFDLEVYTGDQCGESYKMGWEIEDGNGTVIASGGNQNGESWSDYSTYNYDICIDDSCETYNLILYDDGGDAWNDCGHATATLTDPNGNVVVSYNSLGQCCWSQESFPFSSSVQGCTDPTATNYDTNAVCDDGSCCYSGVQFDLEVYTGDQCGESYETGWEIEDGNGTVIASGGNRNGESWSDLSTYNYDICIDDSCETYNLVLYDDNGDAWNDCHAGGSATATLTDASGNIVVSYNANGGSYWAHQYFPFSSSVQGCTDPTATNYDANAVCDDGSCQYPQINWISPSSGDQGQTLSVTISGNNMDYGSQWSGTLSNFRFSQWSGSNMFYGNPTGESGNYLYGDVSIPSGQNIGWYDLEVYNQTTGNWVQKNTAFYVNYPPQINWISPSSGDQGQTLSVTISGTNINYGSQWSGTLSDFRFSQWSGSNMFYGNPTSTSGNDLYGDVSIPYGQNTGWYDLEVYNNNTGNWVQKDDAFFVSISGCTDPLATNYDSTATVDDGSCYYCNMSNTFLLNPPSSISSCDGFALANTYSTYPVTNYIWTNYSTGQVVSNSYYALNLCNDIYIMTATDSATCTITDTLVSGVILGCTDSTAVNYYQFANTDDGSCIPSVYGCTDPSASNYNSLANTDDGSCCYLNVSLYTVNNSSPSSCDGWAFASASGLNPPFTYYWSNFSTNDFIFGLCSGSYSLTITDAAGCTVTENFIIGQVMIYGCTDSTAINYNPTANTDDGSCVYNTYGCTDPTAINYDPTATVDDGSCTYVSCGPITGVNLTDVIHDRATFNWDNMNSSTCDVDQIRFRYREVGTNSYSTKTMGVPVGSGCNTSNTSKLVLGLTPSTTYEYDFKIWYCNASTVSWHANGQFTTLPLCDNVINIIPTPITTTKTEFCWDTVSTYAFVRLKYREDVPGSSFSNIGGMGVHSPTLCKDKNGLTPGLTYRVMWRTWCNPSGGPYRSPQWDGPVLWTQPNSIRVDELSSINSLEVYPNPSRDVFNVSFNSENKQSIEVRLVNLVGEIIFTENLEDFEGEYTHSFNLEQYSKGIYLLELDTDNGIINKKLILQ